MVAPLQLPEIEDRHAFNLERWEAIRADPVFAGFEGRVESDRYGNPVMMPPPHFGHSTLQYRIARMIDDLLAGGTAATECPVSTSEGVKAADVAWISTERQMQSLQRGVLLIAPEICIEVLSPSNTRIEITEKKALYFEAGACEVWLCDDTGRMFFFTARAPEDSREHSEFCPAFPSRVETSGK